VTPGLPGAGRGGGARVARGSVMQRKRPADCPALEGKQQGSQLGTFQCGCRCQSEVAARRKWPGVILQVVAPPGRPGLCFDSWNL
jgi:hypothetical protein